MAQFQHPFQCLRYVARQPAGLSDVFIGSAGKNIYVYAAASGQRLDVWPQNVDTSAEKTDAASTTQDQCPPEKRRKISPGSEEQKNGESKQALSPTWSNIPIVVTSSDGKYVVAVTAEDKSVRVFSLGEDSQMQQLSSRVLPKRPSALVLTHDDQTIVCADKFGDAYSFPLIPSGEYIKDHAQVKPYQPAATSLTVHTKRNLESLEQQLRQAELSKRAEEKPALNFEHQAILGHVSLLTDLISVTLPAGSPSSRARSYILTADRDEHIRVSRGVPQAHVIEQYCLGHTSFISKLCVPSWAPQKLISGGGDNFLLLWNWIEGQALQTVPLADASQTSEVSVHDIWDISLIPSAGATEPVRVILVGLEGYVSVVDQKYVSASNGENRSSQLLCYTLDNESLNLQDTIQLSGNVLDVVGIDSRGLILVSVDTVREPDSTHSWKSAPSSPQTLLESFRVNLGPDSLKWVPVEDSMAVKINAEGTASFPTILEEKLKREFDDALYSLGNLRKKKGEE
ncbi:hypothetical protein NUU61_009418 [Penicillium alfredii]|uniref:Transfer RNA methyltransferase 82 n=1 Tax=Penicillium alfredii TaxID=1506179 RepID=A0A9W9JWV9_9EURO|nr:uncharacterized protein NUU61_009418 [Penicillium alfredii]KAJ5084839.1 hypothetical protein NUU61_009418 [Penicillium alfredii]